MKIVVIHGHAQTLLKERGSLLDGLVRLGHAVYALAPAEDPDVALKFEDMGVDFSLIPLARRGFTPLADIGSLLHLKQALFRIRPGMILSTTAKAMVYGSLAARMAWVGEEKKVFVLVTGLGYAFTEDAGWMHRLRFGLAKSFCQAGFKSCDGVMFRRPEDEAFFRRLGVVPDHIRTGIIGETDVGQDREAVDNAILAFMGLL